VLWLGIATRDPTDEPRHFPSNGEPQ